jgi:cytidylate kinase
MKQPVIAIDGPSGAGKGTVARQVAAALGYRHIDTGAMYRAVGWKALRDHVTLDDERRVADVAAKSRIDVSGARVLIDDIDLMTST